MELHWTSQFIQFFKHFRISEKNIENAFRTPNFGVPPTAPDSGVQYIVTGQLNFKNKSSSKVQILNRAKWTESIWPLKWHLKFS